MSEQPYLAAKIKKSTNFFEDEDFQDQVIAGLCRSRRACLEYAHLLNSDGDDFKPVKAMVRGRPRWIVAEKALRYYQEHSRPIDKLLRAEVLAHAQSIGMGARQIEEIERYLIHLKKVKPQIDAVSEKVIAFKTQHLKAQAIQELVDLQVSGQLTDEKWYEVMSRGASVGAVAPKTESAAALLAASIEEARYLFNPLMPAGELVMVSGRKNAGKTTLALQVALCVARNQPLFGRSVRTPGPVLFVSFEETRVDIQMKLRRLLNEKPMSGAFDLLYALNDAGEMVLPRLDQGGLPKLERLVKAGHDGTPYVLVVVDHLIAAYSAQIGRDVLREQYQQLSPLRRLALQAKTTVLLLHHNRKAESSEFLDDPAGSVGVTAGAGALWVLRRDPEGIDYRRLHVIGRRTKETLLRLKLNLGGFEVIEEGKQIDAGPQQRALLALLKKSGPLSPGQIAKKLNEDGGNVRQLLLRLKKRGLVNKQGVNYVSSAE